MIPDTLASKFIFEPADTYHAAAKDYLSSHQLADFRRCPLLYQWKQLGLAKDKDRPAYFLGRAAHTLILEGRHRRRADQQDHGQALQERFAGVSEVGRGPRQTRPQRGSG